MKILRQARLVSTNRLERRTANQAVASELLWASATMHSMQGSAEETIVAFGRRTGHETFGSV